MSSNGDAALWIWRTDDMRRFHDELFDTVFYLYRSSYEAERGSRVGGCGFFTSIQSDVDPQRKYVHGVTSAHVVENGFLTFRINMQDGSFRAISTKREHWVIHPKDDIAACLMGLDNQAYKVVLIQSSIYAVRDVIESHTLGPGDEVFMIGRFSRFEGADQNRPVMRFGNIARSPGEAIKFAAGLKQDGFLVDMRSLPGFSGSPVFVHIAGLQKRMNSSGLTHPKGPWLLGIDCGSSETEWPILNEDGTETTPKTANTGFRHAARLDNST